MTIDIRKGAPPTKLDRAAFEQRMRRRFADPAFDPLEGEITKIIGAAWDGYSHSRKSPRTEKAGPEFADPDYDLAVEWLMARRAIEDAQRRHDDPAMQKRILLINGSQRCEHTCPGEMSKSYRLCKLAQAIFAAHDYAVDFLDLSRLAAEMGRKIHPCKACVSTAMPLCHWPCSCYPNYSLQQTDDWMNEIYPLWVGARGIMIVTPVNWYQVPTGLKAMMDRLVCADGGNPDPTSTHGKTVAEAKELELKGWDYPKHLAGRLFAVIVHGDAVGAEAVRRALSDWLTDMDLISAGSMAEKDGYIGYQRPYATSHADLDEDQAFQKDVRSAAVTLCRAIALQTEGTLKRADDDLHPAVLK